MLVSALLCSGEDKPLDSKLETIRLSRRQAGMSAEAMIDFERGAYWKNLIQPVDPGLLRQYMEDLAGELPTVLAALMR